MIDINNITPERKEFLEKVLEEPVTQEFKTPVEKKKEEKLPM